MAKVLDVAEMSVTLALRENGTFIKEVEDYTVLDGELLIKMTRAGVGSLQILLNSLDEKEDK